MANLVTFILYFFVVPSSAVTIIFILFPDPTSKPEFPDILTFAFFESSAIAVTFKESTDEGTVTL